MRRRRHYALAFLAVLLAALGGFWLARDLSRALTLPQLALPQSVQQVLAGMDLFSLLPRLSPATTSDAEANPARPLQTPQAVIVEGIEPTATGAAPEQPATPASAMTPSATPPSAVATAAPVALPFELAGSVRHTAGDCPGASIRGVVRDAAGNLLAGVRLWHYDQWGNEQVTESKSGDAERGQYEFPVGDTANVHYVQVIDAGGVIISPVVEIQHRQGEAPDALCHWVDWLRR